MKVSACVLFSQQPSGLFSVSLPHTETVARSTSQVNSHSCWLAPHQHHTHRYVNFPRSKNKPDQMQRSQIPLREPMLCCLVCFPAPPSSVCRSERASRPQLGRQGTARPAARSEPAVHRKTLPSLSQHQPRQSMRGKLSLSLLSPSLFLPTWLETTFHSLTVRVKKKPFSPSWQLSANSFKSCKDVEAHRAEDLTHDLNDDI